MSDAQLNSLNFIKQQTRFVWRRQKSRSSGGCLETLTNRYTVEAKTAVGRLDLEQLKRTLARYHYELDTMQRPVGIGDNRFLLKALSDPRGNQTGEYEEIERLGIEIIRDGKDWLHAKNSNFSSLKNAGISSLKLIQKRAYGVKSFKLYRHRYPKCLCSNDFF